TRRESPRKLARLLLRDLLALLTGLGQADGDRLLAAGNLPAASPTLERSALLLMYRALHVLGSRPRIFAWHKLISCCGRRGNVSSNGRFLNPRQRANLHPVRRAQWQVLFRPRSACQPRRARRTGRSHSRWEVSWPCLLSASDLAVSRRGRPARRARPCVWRSPLRDA